jgi:3-oxoacyl-[acyl-carrier-protein] synthase II
LENQLIEIKGCGLVSPLGIGHGTGTGHGLAHCSFDGVATPVGVLPPEAEEQVQAVMQDNPLLRQVDRSVLLAVYAARQAARQAGWKAAGGREIAVNIGSSRGATASFEKFFQSFQSSPGHAVPPQASPVTTLGNISSWVAQDLQAEGPLISHSITCSTALQAIGNAMAWLRSGMATRFLAGGAEAPLTPFTLAQMKALGIYSPPDGHSFPCRPCNTERTNTFVLGEGAAVFALEMVPFAELTEPSDTGRIVVESLGFGFEQIRSKTGISGSGLHFQKAMTEALALAPAPAFPDLIILHAPGTVAGDAAEIHAVRQVFGPTPPAMCSNKWQVGHLLGASAALSVALAIDILQGQRAPAFPYPTFVSNHLPRTINRILVNAAGFGGNAASLLLARAA